MGSKKRAHGEGHFEQLPSGKWRMIFYEGGVRLKPGPARATKAEAKRAYREREIQARNAQSIRQIRKQGLTLAGHVLEWFPATGNTVDEDALAYLARVRPSTAQGLRYNLYALSATKLGSLPIEHLTERVLLQFAQESTLSPRTIKNYLNDLRRFGKLIGFDVPIVKQLPQVLPAKARIVTREDFPEFLKLARTPCDRLMLAIFFHCGLRNQELCALTKADAQKNPHGTQLFIHSTIGKGRSGWEHIQLTKTNYNRRVPITWKWLAKEIANAPDGYLVHLGDPAVHMNPKSMRQRLDTLTKGTRFSTVNPQDLRRSAATQYALSGVPIHLAAKILGHSEQMLLDIYAQYSNEELFKVHLAAMGGE